MEVTTGLRQANVHAQLHLYDVRLSITLNLRNFFCNFLFQYVSCPWFLAEHSFLKVSPQSEIKRC
jgi:hypothetical protein